MFTVQLSVVESVRLPSMKKIIRGFRGEREKSALYNITCLGEILVPFPTFNLFNQSLKKGGVNTANRAP